MQKPDLNRMWETFIKIGSLEGISLQQIIRVIRSEIYPMINDLKQRKIIDWYHFLIHDRKSGVPTTEDDSNPYFHVRFTLNKDIVAKDEKDVFNFLPNYCVMTRRIERPPESIAGINKSIIKTKRLKKRGELLENNLNGS